MAAIEELAVEYDPVALRATVERRRKLVKGRVISLGITIALMIIFYVWQRALFSPAVYVLYAVGLSVALGFLVFRYLSFRQAAAELATAGEGTAIKIGRGGVQVADLGTGWAQVAGLAVVNRGLGREQAVRLTTTDGRTSLVPLDQVVIFPATLDGTARAYSGGRHGVDLSALDT